MSLPASWLAGLLLLAVTSALLPGAFTAPLVSVAVVLALLLSDALGSSAVAGKLVAMIGLPARHALLATAWRASSGREYPLKQPTDR